MHPFHFSLHAYYKIIQANRYTKGYQLINKLVHTTKASAAGVIHTIFRVIGSVLLKTHHYSETVFPKNLYVC